jgi:uncharacterized protein YkwD
MLEQKMMRRILWCLAACLMACQSTDDSDLQGEQIGEPVSMSRLTPVDEESDLEGTSQALVAELLCKPCTTSAECGGIPNYCLRRSDGVRFCGGDCRTTACPASYSCTRLSTSVYQCVPPQADCSRVTPSADAGTGTDAGAPRDAGTTADAGAASDAGTVPGGAHCAPTANWDATWTAFEDEVLRLSNQYRQAGATCGTTSYAPAPPLATSPALRCAARLHSKDMQDRNYFSHTTPDGVTFDQRITQAGYRWRTIGENIAAGYRTPAAVVQGWMQSPGHCQNIMNGTFTQLGVGFYGEYRWTQDFGTPF